MVFRLYRTLPADLPLLGGGNFIRNGVRSLRNVVRGIQGELSPTGTNSPLAGRILEREFKFVLLLEQLVTTPEVRTSFTYTDGAFFVDLPFRSAKGVTRFSISGRTHWTPIYVDGVPVDGESAFQDLSELLDDFLYPKEGLPADRRLIWLNYLAPISAEDPIGEFEWEILPVKDGLRSVQSNRQPFMRSFNLNFLGLRSNKDLAKSEDGFLAGLFARGYLKRLLDAFPFDIGTFIADALDLVFGTLDDVIGLVNDLSNLARTLNDYVASASQFITYSFAEVQELLTAVDMLIATVEEGIDDVRNIPAQAQAQYEALLRRFPGMTGSGSPTVGILAADRLRKVRHLLLALRAQPQSFIDPALPGTPRAGVLNLTVQPDTSIERIAAAAGLDVPTLVNVNGLRHPYLDARPRPERQVEHAQEKLAQAVAAITDAQSQGKSGAALAPFIAARDAAAVDAVRWKLEAAARPSVDGVLYAGDVIRIPVSTRDRLPSIVGIAGNQVLASRRAVTDDERLLGFDLLLEDGDLVWDDDGNDIRIVGGTANFHQTQKRYVALPLGALRFAPGLGSYHHENLSRWQGPGTNRLQAYSLHKTLVQDPRVSDIRRVRSRTYAGSSEIVYDVELINGRSVPDLRLPLAA